MLPMTYRCDKLQRRLPQVRISAARGMRAKKHQIDRNPSWGSTIINL
jgi:hypothetical protein